MTNFYMKSPKIPFIQKEFPSETGILSELEPKQIEEFSLIFQTSNF